VNGQFDLAAMLLTRGADPNLTGENGVAPLYAAINLMWAPRAGYPQPRAQVNQQLGYLEFMKKLLDAGADPNQRVNKKVWYTNYNFDQSGVDEVGATPFWRAAYGADVEAMKLLASYGADPSIPTMKPAERPETGDAGRRESRDVSRQAPIPYGGPGVPPLLAAAGVGYGEGFAGNSHRHAPGGMLAAVKYLIEELGADVNARDHEGNNAIHHAASRGDLEMIQYLVSKGADRRPSTAKGRPRSTWRMDRCSACSRGLKRSSTSKPSAQKITISACLLIRFAGFERFAGFSRFQARFGGSLGSRGSQKRFRRFTGS
jgi:hypothetical protein